LALTLLDGPPVQSGDKPLDPDEQLLKEAKVGTDNASLLEFLRQCSVDDTALKVLDQLIRQLGSENFAEREQASRKLTVLGPAALPPLLQAQRGSDREIGRRAADCTREVTAALKPPLPLAVVRLLARRHPAGTVETLLRYLPYAVYDPELEEEVWFALDALAVRDGKLDPAFAGALRDALPARRAVAGCILGRRGDPDQRAIVRKLLNDTAPVVRLRAAQGLLAAKDKDALPVLIALLEEPSVALAWQAEELLRWVAGEEAPEATVGAGSAESLQACRKAWEGWWQRHGQALDLTKLDQDHGRPGLCFLFTRSQFFDGRGAIWLIGCDGKVRWRLTNLDGLADAHLLPADRVLVAQWTHPAPLPGQPARAPVSHVAELDLHGKTVWKYAYEGTDIDRRTIACQRLPNGNTFIGTRRVYVLEVTPEGREVDSWDFGSRAVWEGFEKPDVLHLRGEFSQRLSNGHFLYHIESGSNRLELIELDPSFRLERQIPGARGRVLKQVSVREKVEIGAKQATLLPNGNFLIPDRLTDRLLEVDGTGQVVWRSPLVARHAAHLRNGNRLLLCGGRVAEVNPAGKVVWEAFTDVGPDKVRDCLSLVRLGFDAPRPANLDLDASIPYRIKGLTSKDVVVRRGTARQLEELGPKAVGAVPVLIEALDDRDGLVCVLARETLISVGPEVIPSLSKVAKDKRPKIRAAVARIFGYFPGQAQVVVPLLVEGLKDENVLVRRDAAWALGYIGPPAKDGAPALASALKDPDKAEKPSETCVSYAAARSLGDIGPAAREAVPALIEALKTEDARLLTLVIWALGQIGPAAKAAVLDLVDVLQDKKRELSVRRVASEALGKIGPEAKAAVPALREVLSDVDDELRANAAKAIERIQR
jgi:HEAT repeat protein